MPSPREAYPRPPRRRCSTSSARGRTSSRWHRSCCEMRARAPGVRHVLVHTGQHYDADMSAIFFEELGLPEPDYLLGVGSGTHGVQTARALERLEAVLAELRPCAMVVPGDVNSTLAAALAAAKLGIPVAHLEAGLRSFDRTMPEEINRVLVDQLSRWCFIHSPEAATNLGREGIGEERVQICRQHDDRYARRPAPRRIDGSRRPRRLGLERRRYLLVTLHRPALVDGPLLGPVIECAGRRSRTNCRLCSRCTRARERAFPRGIGLRPGLQILDPLGYVDFLALEASAAASHRLGRSSGGDDLPAVPCFTLRDNTERPVTSRTGRNRLLGLRPDAIERIPGWLANPAVILDAPPGWDGHASKRVADVLLSDRRRRHRHLPPSIGVGRRAVSTAG